MSGFKGPADSRPDRAVERYRNALKSGSGISWQLVNDLRAAGHLGLAEEALRALAFTGDMRARAELFFIALRNLFAWLSPGAWTRRKIQRTRVPETVFDTGPGGLAGWYGSMQHEIGVAVQHIVAAGAALGIMASIFVAMPDWAYDQLLNATTLKVVIFALWLSLPLRAAWHWEVARVYGAEWEALEAHGLLWHFENNHYFRFIFRRLDGSYKIDPSTRQQRLDAEIQAVRWRDGQLVGAAKNTVVTLLKAAGIFVGSYIVIGYVPWRWLMVWNVPLILTCWYVWTALPAPLAQWLRHFSDRRAYEAGKQFIPWPRVFDPLHEPPTLETVKRQAALGDAAFTDPRDASKGMRS